MSDGRNQVRGGQVRGGFSLIEVLIGILVLALGLVGLAAVFPTVVRQQQVAADQSLGVSVGKSAVATLKKHRELSRTLSDANYLEALNYPPLTTDTLDTTIDLERLVGWSILTWNTQWSLDGSWDLPYEGTSPTPTEPISIDPASGNCIIGSANGYYVRQVVNGTTFQDDPRKIRTGGIAIRTADRLVPNAETPRFVWDFVARRVDLGERHLGTELRTYRDDGVQVVVFVRRIDPGIRVPTNGTLRNEIVGGSATRVPVAASPTNVPTLDGLGGTGGVARYSIVQPLQFVFGSDANGPRYDLLDLNGPEAALLPYAAQVGQRFVDQLGGVHKVVEVLDPVNPATRRVRLESAMRADYATAAPQPNGAMELIFVPQIPASVEVFSTSPGDPS